MILVRDQRRLISRTGRSVRAGVAGFYYDLKLDELGDYIMYRALLKHGLYEPGTSRLITASLKQGSTFVDVGANSGYYSLLAARCVGPGGRVYAFEPYPIAFARLVENIQLNGLGPLVRAECAAVADYSGTSAFYVSDFDDTRNSLVSGIGREIRVRVTRLDDAIKGVGIEMVKIDAEGSELSVIRGMKTVLSMNPNLSLVLEWNRNYSGPELWSVLTSLFDVYRILDVKNSYELATIRDPRELRGICNLYCKRKS